MRQRHQNRIQAFAFVMSACMAVCFALSIMSGLGASQTTYGQPELRSHVNPNDAPIESLVRLPGLGAGRAGAIVAYREKLRKENGGSSVFDDCTDLLKVSGIGPKTLQSISEWLTFD
jgi:competence protein ComEA